MMDSTSSLQVKPEDCTIIIPHLQGIPEANYALVQCVISLKETTKSPIIIATNGEEPKPLPAASTGIACDFDVPQIKRIHIWDQGQCKASNAAVATINTEWIFVTNNDMVYAPGWWEKMTEYKTSLCMSPRLVEPRPGASTFVVEFCGGAGGDFDKQKWLKFAAEYMKGQYTQEKGFNLPFLIKKELWDLIGGYDINFDPWGSNGDSDLEYKIRLAGIQPMQVRNCPVYHFSQTSGTFHPDNQVHWQKNWDYFIEKWGFPRTDDGIWEANFHLPTKEEGRIFLPEWEGKYGSVNK